MEAAPTTHNPAADMEARARAPPPSTSVVTCVACRVRLHGPDTRRTHYLSDWHRANIKRKLASLPPLTPDEYTRRVEALATASGGAEGVGRGDGGGGGHGGASGGDGGAEGQEGPPSGVVVTPSALAAELLDAAGLSAAATATSGAAALVPTATGGGDGSASRQVVPASVADTADPPLQGGADVGEVMDKITSSLVLPNGRVLGHRDLARFYKQRPSPAADARALARSSTRSAVLSSYKRLGWAGPAVSRAAAADQRIQLLRSKREHLRVGMSNYYTRKAAVRPKLGVLNSGYRP
ncbi:hypothetical protein I4F81_009157 [Pyropia yezoensis]|uniref:Uncharacterized protein n=1 Tax=Pyropia yezoensis TaxID=2788 RepID=A0ACC3C8N3_PYRYE|nr:hypothetical protein I4F81_009157 [Neopyropia yezoensis]